MLTLSTIIYFSMIASLQTLSPGPAVTLLINEGISNGFKKTLLFMIGFRLGEVMLITASLVITYVGAKAFSEYVYLIKLVGGAYLVFLGCRIILNKRRVSSTNKKDDNRFFVSLIKSMVTTLSNPKAIIFFSTFIPSFIYSLSDYEFNFIILGIVFICVSMTTDLLYAAVSSIGKNIVNASFIKILSVISGSSLILTGSYSIFSGLS
ncbi:LysE family translocator [Pectobacterium punjabense]|uniref:LysE family translocator n=1 Tax=Pectobacterium punjabense TaxID=2108399 RepID=UPI0032F02C8A